MCAAFFVFSHELAGLRSGLRACGFVAFQSLDNPIINNQQRKTITMPKKNGSPTKKEKWSQYKQERAISALTIFKPSADITSTKQAIKNLKEREAKIKAERETKKKKNKKKIKKIHHTELLTKKAAATILNKPVNSFGKLPYLPNIKYTIPRPYKKSDVAIVKQLLDQLTDNPQSVKKAVVYSQYFNYDEHKKDDYYQQQSKNYDYCMENQYLVIENIADNTDERDNVLPGLQSIIKMAANREFDTLVMESHKRLRCTNPHNVIEQMRNTLPITIVFSGCDEQKPKRVRTKPRIKDFFKPTQQIIDLDPIKLRKFRYRVKEQKRLKKSTKKTIYKPKKKTTTPPERVKMSHTYWTKPDAAKFINVPVDTFCQTPYIPKFAKGAFYRYRETDVRRVKPIIDDYIREPKTIKKAVVYTQLYNHNADYNKEDYNRQQIKNYNYCLKNKYLVIGHFADYTEDSDNVLPGLQSIVKMAANREFELLVMENLYRLRCNNPETIIEQMRNTLPIKIVFSECPDD